MPELFYPDPVIVYDLIKAKIAEIEDLYKRRLIGNKVNENFKHLPSEVIGAISEAIEALKTSATSVGVQLIQSGEVPNSTAYNKFWKSVQIDLKILFKAMTDLGNILKDQHNYIMSDVDNLILSLKMASSKLSNYALYAAAESPNERTFIETFNDITQLDALAPAPDGKAEVSTVEGIVTLGVSQRHILTKTEVAAITINSTLSNGTIYGSRTLMDIINSGDFLLFEYERTASTSDNIKLTLDFTIALNELTILNHIRIVPNNFGTRTWPKITRLDVSEDGSTYDSLRDELLGDSTDDTPFTLAPYSSKYAGEGRFSFIPRRIRYIRLTIEQVTPYLDPVRNVWRWPIGIKNIELTQLTYKDTSEVTSKDYAVGHTIGKISLDGIDYPQRAYAESVQASTADIRYAISVDGGSTWKPISPRYFQNTDAAMAEIINVNNIDSQNSPNAVGSINTSFEATSLRYKIKLYKNSSGVEIADDLLPYYTPVVRSVTLSVTTKEVI
jgi:hypothetical protein